MARAAFSWIPADIRSYRSLYKGRRFWVFENDFARPYGIHTDRQYDQVLVYDSEIDAVVANGHWAEDGTINGCSFWGQGVTFASADPAGLVAAVKDIDRMMER